MGMHKHNGPIYAWPMFLVDCKRGSLDWFQNIDPLHASSRVLIFPSVSYGAQLYSLRCPQLASNSWKEWQYEACMQSKSHVNMYDVEWDLPFDSWHVGSCVLDLANQARMNEILSNAKILGHKIERGPSSEINYLEATWLEIGRCFL